MAPMQRENLLARVRQYVNTPGGARISMWISFFVFWGGTAAFLPYISVYYESVGLRGAQIGQLNSIPYFIALFSSIIFGFLSDVFRRHKLMLAVCTIGMIAVLFVFPLASTFLALLPIVLMFSILQAPCIPLMDQTTLSSLDNPANYGKVRAGGSIGWGIMVLATGFLIDQLDLGLPVIFYINIAFYSLFLMLIAFQPNPRRKSADEHQRASLSKILELFK
jgi:MFS transporter, PPP family, 3-phenylpropionic acid transporter